METPVQLIPLLEPIRPEMERVEHLLCETLAQVEEPLNSMLRHVLNGGKRVRSALVILVGCMFAAPTPPFHRLAAAVDLLHAATLIHDDLIDGASTRRGRQTLHTTWPMGATVLAGDYLLGQATALIAELEHSRILAVFSWTLRTMCAGEIRRIFTASDEHSRREDYYASVEAKTASLFAASAAMAGLLAGAEERQITALRRFGRELGMAFQITDDVLDFTGDERRLGKPAGSDLRQGLVTLPTLYYLEMAEDDALVSAVLAGRRDGEHVQEAIEAVRSSGAIEATLAEARAHVAQSQRALAILPEGIPRQTLHSLAEYVVKRRI